MRVPRPADECPFFRPISQAPAGCPAFHPVQYLPLDLKYRPLRPVLTCRHMRVGVRPGEPKAFYCRCGIGDATAREAVGAAATGRRRRLMRAVVDRLNQVIAAHAESLAEAKGRELAAPPGPDREAARGEVRAAAVRLEFDFERSVGGELRGTLDELGVEPDALLAIVRAGVRDYERHGLESWEIPDPLLAPLPADVVRFVKAGYGR